jgi:hypothetical protein
MNFRDYLECQNASATSNFATSGPAGSFNDQVLAVSAADIWSVVEAAIAARFAQEIQPALAALLNAAYTTDQWGVGVSAANPLLPLAGTPFADGSTFPKKGGLPLWRTDCDPATAGYFCDPNLIRWTLSPAPTFAKRGGSAEVLSSTCTASTTSQVRCTVRYGGWCGGGLGFLLGGQCHHTLEGSVRASAENVGNSLRNFTTAGITGFTSLVSSKTPINATGSAEADIRGHLPQPTCNAIIILGLLFPCWAEDTVTLTLPRTIFPENPALGLFYATFDDPSVGVRWYLKNRWHELSYYAVAPTCTSGGANCLQVAQGNLPPKVRALVALTGYSLSGATRPNANLNDYLDSALNSNNDESFEQKLAGRSFNDRFFAVSNY